MSFLACTTWIMLSSLRPVSVTKNKMERKIKRTIQIFPIDHLTARQTQKDYREILNGVERFTKTSFNLFPSHKAKPCKLPKSHIEAYYQSMSLN
ncbi:hypothetical protein CIPAW_09G187500 [Carya illinoinensis]|uniref:Ribosomal protein S10 n=1 Tax=Carya illinoinensis TaxID=32201 RepID=A0A8T1PLX7_CARIL|nr:hypothetical protein CIPAW_09G187500 [Carya illinoinensis]